MKLDEQKAKVAAKKDADAIQKQIDLKAKFKAAMKKTDDSVAKENANITKWEAEKLADPAKFIGNDKKITTAKAAVAKLLDNK